MWTMDNTEGFTQAELDMLNRVAERIFASAADDDDAANVNDALNNCWVDGISEAALESAARKRLGIAA
jgi:hypothetical protein